MIKMHLVNEILQLILTIPSFGGTLLIVTPHLLRGDSDERVWGGMGEEVCGLC